MNGFMLLIMLGIVATLGVLFTGLGSMVQGGEADVRHAHQWMFARIALQAFTLLLVVAAVWLNVR